MKGNNIDLWLQFSYSFLFIDILIRSSSPKCSLRTENDFKNLTYKHITYYRVFLIIYFATSHLKKNNKHVPGERTQGQSQMETGSRVGGGDVCGEGEWVG